MPTENFKRYSYAKKGFTTFNNANYCIYLPTGKRYSEKEKNLNTFLNCLRYGFNSGEGWKAARFFINNHENVNENDDDVVILSYRNDVVDRYNFKKW